MYSSNHDTVSRSKSSTTCLQNNSFSLPSLSSLDLGIMPCGYTYNIINMNHDENEIHLLDQNHLQQHYTNTYISRNHHQHSSSSSENVSPSCSVSSSSSTTISSSNDYPNETHHHNNIHSKPIHCESTRLSPTSSNHSISSQNFMLGQHSNQQQLLDNSPNESTNSNQMMMNHANNIITDPTATITTTTDMTDQELLRAKKLDVLSADEIRQYFCYTQSDAARLLGVSVSTLKRRFYELNLGNRWPYKRTKQTPRKKKAGTETEAMKACSNMIVTMVISAPPPPLPIGMRRTQMKTCGSADSLANETTTSSSSNSSMKRSYSTTSSSSTGKIEKQHKTVSNSIIQGISPATVVTTGRRLVSGAIAHDHNTMPNQTSSGHNGVVLPGVAVNFSSTTNVQHQTGGVSNTITSVSSGSKHAGRVDASPLKKLSLSFILNSNENSSPNRDEPNTGFFPNENYCHHSQTCSSNQDFSFCNSSPHYQHQSLNPYHRNL